MFALILAAHAASDPYCNEAMATGLIPPLPSAELVQVHVLIRHGSRVVSDAKNCLDRWEGSGEASYNCTATLLEGASAPAFPASGLPGGSVLYRKTYAEGRNAVPGNCATGALVESGLEMQRANGRHLRQAYDAILPVSPAGDNASAFLLRSDDCPRTLASGQELVASLFPSLGGAPLVVPWLTEDSAGEETITCSSEKVCPAFPPAAKAAQQAYEASAHFASVSVPLAAELSDALNRTVSAAGIGGLLDCLMSVSCPTVPSSGGRPPPSFTPALQQRVVDETAHAMYAVYNDSAVSRLGAGPLIGEILMGMEKAAGLASAAGGAAPAFVLLSGHDTGPMAPVLAALRIGGGAFGWAFPHFADLIAIELYRTSATSPTSPASKGFISYYAVRVVHDGDVVTEGVPGCPAGQQLCPFEAFHAAAAALTPSPQECGRPDSPAWWPVPHGVNP